MEEHRNAFEDSEFYILMQSGSTESILEALELIEQKKVDVKLTSHQAETKGWTYLHFVVKRYTRLEIKTLLHGIVLNNQIGISS